MMKKGGGGRPRTAPGAVFNADNASIITTSLVIPLLVFAVT